MLPCYLTTVPSQGSGPSLHSWRCPSPDIPCPLPQPGHPLSAAPARTSPVRCPSPDTPVRCSSPDILCPLLQPRCPSPDAPLRCPALTSLSAQQPSFDQLNSMATSRMYQAAAAAAAGFLPAVSMAAGVPGSHAPAFGGFDPLRSMEQHTAQGELTKDARRDA